MIAARARLECAQEGETAAKKVATIETMEMEFVALAKSHGTCAEEEAIRAPCFQEVRRKLQEGRGQSMHCKTSRFLLKMEIARADYIDQIATQRVRHAVRHLKHSCRKSTLQLHTSLLY